MFANACEKAAKFTRPVITSTRLVNGKVNASCASYIVINDEGWIITAGHVFDSFVKFQNDQKKIKEIGELNNRNVAPGAMTSTIQKDPEWITNHSFWWGIDGVRLNSVYVNRVIDIAVGKLEPFDKKWIKEYPVFRKPDTLAPGTSVCRTGFPFVEIESTFDEKNNAFHIDKKFLPLPLFPNDGIHTRNIHKGTDKKENIDMLYVETSSPGLRGQSGGPIFDTNGYLYAMQVQTMHIPLGFHPSVEFEGKKITENQFINVGVGVHAKTIVDVLRARNVRFSMEGEDSGFRIID